MINIPQTCEETKADDMMNHSSPTTLNNNNMNANHNNHHQSLTMLLMDGDNHSNSNNTSLMMNQPQQQQQNMLNQSSMMVDSNLVMQMMRLMMNESSHNNNNNNNNHHTNVQPQSQHSILLSAGSQFTNNGGTNSSEVKNNASTSSPTATTTSLRSSSVVQPSNVTSPLQLDVTQFQQQLAQVMAVCSQQPPPPPVAAALSTMLLANHGQTPCSTSSYSSPNNMISNHNNNNSSSPNMNVLLKDLAPNHPLQQVWMNLAAKNNHDSASALWQQLFNNPNHHPANTNISQTSTPPPLSMNRSNNGSSGSSQTMGNSSNATALDPAAMIGSSTVAPNTTNKHNTNLLQVPPQTHATQVNMVESPGSLSSMTEMEQTANSIHVFIKKGFPPKKKGNHLTSEQPWHRLANPQSIHHSPNVVSSTKLSEKSTCKIGTDCYYYLLLVLPSKYYSLSDLEFQLEEETKDEDESTFRASKKKASPKKKNILPHVEMKIRGKDLSATTKFLGHGRNGTPQHASPSADSLNSNIIAIFEILANKKKNKATKSDKCYTALLKCKKEKLVTMYIDIHSSCETANHEVEESNDVLDLSNHEAASSDSTSTSTIKKRKKNDDENEMEDDDAHSAASSSEVGQPQIESSARKRSKSSSIPLQNNTNAKQKAAHPPTLFDQLKQWIIVTVFHQSISVDLSKFPNFAFPKELSPNEQFLLYVDVPTQLSEDHDICFKILDFQTQQELTFAGEQWIDTNVVNCCNFNIQASLMSLHVEYAISFRDINHDRPLVFIVALKDKKTEVERIIYNGTPFNIKRGVSQALECIDELGVSAIQYPGFDAALENSAIAEIFDEIPTVNSGNTTNTDSFFASFNMVSESENILEDDFESLFGQ
nr:unnamed protein product [Naegleria fowleri]